MAYMSGDEVRRRREALGLSQAELAEWAGVHVMTVSKWERGIHKPPRLLATVFSLLEQRADLFDPHRFKAGRRAARASAGAGEAGDG
jgi:DNA-binding transcriptional regulator YiaG